MSRRARVPWDDYIEEIADGLRVGESSEQLADRINKEFRINPPLTKNNFISGLRDETTPITRLLIQHYPDEVEALLDRYRSKAQNGGGFVAVQPPISPLEAARRECKGYPSTPMRFPCSELIYDEATGGEEPCGKVTNQPFCPAHRRLAWRRMAATMASTVVRIG